MDQLCRVLCWHNPKTLKNNSTKENDNRVEFSKTILGSLPNEIVYEIVCYLGYNHMYPIISICKSLNSLLNDDYWNFYIRVYRIPIVPNLSPIRTVQYHYGKKWTSPLRNIMITENGKSVSRVGGTGASNPVVPTTKPLTKEDPSFECKIISRGSWLGIGLADQNIVLNKGNTLGRQKQSNNYAIFCQDFPLLQGCSNKKQLDDYPLNCKLRADDHIKIHLDYDTNKIIFTINDTSYIMDPKINLSRIKLYPCVNLSSGTKLTRIV